METVSKQNTINKLVRPSVKDATNEVEAMLFQVWIDLNFGEGNPDWWWNSPPQELKKALMESAACRSGGWVSVVIQEGENPRDDGRWDNP